MPFMRLRRAVLTAALASSALLAACGGGDIVDQFTPSRGVLLDGGGNNWAQNVLNRYGSVPATSPAGTADFAVASTPVGAGLGTPSLAQRVDAALAAGLQEGDLVVLSAGVPDIVAEANGARSTAAMQAAGRAMADQVRRLVDGGAKHVLVANAYDLSKAPQFRGGPLERTAFGLTRAFNDALASEGAVSLHVLEQVIDNWLADRVEAAAA